MKALDGMAMVRAPSDLAEAAGKLHDDALFDDGDTVLTPMAEQHFLLGVSALDQAKAHFKLAEYFASRKD